MMFPISLDVYVDCELYITTDYCTYLSVIFALCLLSEIAVFAIIGLIFKLLQTQKSQR